MPESRHAGARHTGPADTRPAAEGSHQFLTLERRLSPAIQLLLLHLGAHMESVHSPKGIGPDLCRVSLPGLGRRIEWLEPAAAEALLEALHAEERRPGAPEWLRALMAGRRAGTLPGGDGALDLADAPIDARNVLSDLLAVPVPERMPDPGTR